MLGFLPQLYPDELLHSWMARYHLYSMNNGPKQTMEDLFGQQLQLAVPDLPNNLERLNGRVQHFMKHTTDEWIVDHTFFRYYTTFALPNVRQKVKEVMAESADTDKTAMHMLTGVMASAVKENEYFCYCPLCVTEDIETLGETYWRLSHQLPGVLICNKHQISLCNSQVPFRPINRHELVAATRENCPSIVSIQTYDKKTMEHLYHLALETERLVSKEFEFDLEMLQRAYRNLLQRKGLTTAKGRVHQGMLAEQFRAFYGDECLQFLQSAVDFDSDSCWLKAITRKHRKAFHPIRHLLFIRFLGESLEMIMSYSSEVYEPFGSAPYPCLNRAADHFLKPVIGEVEISVCTDTRRLVGTFTCSCGFIFMRRGPDQTNDDRFKIGRIRQFGDVWMKRLHQLVRVEKFSFRAAARELGVDTKTVIKYSEAEIGKSESSNKDNTLLEGKQKEWIDLMDKHPTLTVTQLRWKNSALYAWLYRNCREWLAQHSPTGRTRVVKGQVRIDWEKRDQRLVKQVQKAIKETLLESSPIRITVHRIVSQLESVPCLASTWTNYHKQSNVWMGL